MRFAREYWFSCAVNITHNADELLRKSALIFLNGKFHFGMFCHLVIGKVLK